MYDDNILRIRHGPNPTTIWPLNSFPPFPYLLIIICGEERIFTTARFLYHHESIITVNFLGIQALQMRSPLLFVLISWPCQANYSTWMIPIKKKATGNFDLLCLCTSDQTKNRPHFFVLNTSYISVRSGRRTNGPVSR